MAMQIKGALVTGDVTKVQEYATNGTVTPGTLCITSVGKKICIVNKDKSVSVLSDEEHIFESVEEAKAWIADPASGAKAGAPIVVKDGSGYKHYVVNTDEEGGLVVEEPVGGGGSSESGPVWEEL